MVVLESGVFEKICFCKSSVVSDCPKISWFSCSLLLFQLLSILFPFWSNHLLTPFLEEETDSEVFPRTINESISLRFVVSPFAKTKLLPSDFESDSSFFKSPTNGMSSESRPVSSAPNFLTRILMPGWICPKILMTPFSKAAESTNTIRWFVICRLSLMICFKVSKSSMYFRLSNVVVFLSVKNSIFMFIVFYLAYKLKRSYGSALG